MGVSVGLYTVHEAALYVSAITSLTSVLRIYDIVHMLLSTFVYKDTIDIAQLHELASGYYGHLQDWIRLSDNDLH